MDNTQETSPAGYSTRWLVLILIGMSSLLCGCAALLIGTGAAAGAGTVAYVRGELSSYEEVTLDRAWEATQAAMKDLEFAVTTKTKDALSARLVARNSSDKKVQVNLKKQGDKLVEIRIRVGVFGDASLSRLIYEKIKKHL